MDAYSFWWIIAIADMQLDFAPSEEKFSLHEPHIGKLEQHGFDAELFPF